MGNAGIVMSRTNDGAVLITLRGSITIEQSTELRDVLLDAFSSSQRVVLDMTQLESIDLTVMQLLCSACKTAAKDKRIFVRENGFPVSLSSLYKGVSVPQMSACSQNNNKPCIWFGGDV